MNGSVQIRSNGNNLEKSKDSILILLCSATCMIISHFYKLSLKKKYKNLKNTKIYSTDEFLKNKTYLAGKDVIVIGRYKKQNSFFRPDPFFLQNHKESKFLQLFTNKNILISPGYFSYINPRRGFVEKTLAYFDFFRLLSLVLLFKSFQSISLSLLLHSQNKELIDEYFLDGDIVGVYGTVTNIGDNTYSINPSFVFQGNSRILKNVMKSQIYHYDNLFKISAISFICQSLVKFFNYLEKTIWPGRFSYKSMVNKPRVNCSKCQINLANVVMNDCNHFNLCYKCFQGMNRKCRICNMKIKDYTVLYG